MLYVIQGDTLKKWVCKNQTEPFHTLELSLLQHIPENVWSLISHDNIWSIIHRLTEKSVRAVIKNGTLFNTDSDNKCDYIINKTLIFNILKWKILSVVRNKKTEQIFLYTNSVMFYTTYMSFIQIHWARHFTIVFRSLFSFCTTQYSETPI
jgi:hypothetical protein